MVSAPTPLKARPHLAVDSTHVPVEQSGGRHALGKAATPQGQGTAWSGRSKPGAPPAHSTHASNPGRARRPATYANKTTGFLMFGKCTASLKKKLMSRSQQNRSILP